MDSDFLLLDSINECTFIGGKVRQSTKWLIMRVVCMLNIVVERSLVNATISSEFTANSSRNHKSL